MTGDQDELIDDLAEGRLSRREFARRAALVGLSVPTISGLLAACGSSDSSTGTSSGSTGAARASGPVTMVSYGGSYNDNLEKAFMTPFERASGIKVDLGENTSLAQLKLQVSSGNVQWDIAELTGPEYEIGAKQDLFEPFDYKVIDASKVPERYKRPAGIKYSLYLFVMAWDAGKIADPKKPGTWAEFFDPARYDSKRSLYDNLSDGSLLEVALIADGVPKDQLYPLDVDRALRKLDAMGYDKIIFHSTNQEPIQQLTSGEVPLSTSFTGRVVPAQAQGADIAFTPNEGAVSGDYLVVPKGAKHKDAAFELIDFIVSNDDACAEYMNLTTYASANAKAVELVPPNVRAQLPTSDELRPRVFDKDDAYWAQNLDAVTKKFKQWQVGH